MVHAVTNSLYKMDSLVLQNYKRAFLPVLTYFSSSRFRTFLLDGLLVLMPLRRRFLRIVQEPGLRFLNELKHALCNL